MFHCGVSLLTKQVLQQFPRRPVIEGVFRRTARKVPDGLRSLTGSMSVIRRPQ